MMKHEFEKRIGLVITAGENGTGTAEGRDEL
jgi:hypothetical protein